MDTCISNEIIEGPYYITTIKHQFELTIKKNKYTDYIHVGNKRFNFCIELGIRKEDGIPVNGKLIQVKAEPECGFPTFLNRGDSISMILVTFQLCKELYPTVTSYEFDDESHIDCGVQIDPSMPPRKTIKPISLAYLSIAIYGKTWYERHFNARMINSAKYEHYRKSIEQLHFPISAKFSNFTEFIQTYYLSQYVQETLSPYFDIDKTWNEFFSSIPKHLHCDVFYNWLPTCISRLIDYSYFDRGWMIDITTLRQLNINITNNPVYKGGKQSKTRKRKHSKLYFSNTPHGSLIL